MENWQNALKLMFFVPEQGSIWKAPNKIWPNGFAAERPKEELHPSIVEKLSPCQTIVQLAPGTSKDYNLGSCVFRVKLNSDSKTTYFLLKFSMPYPKSDLLSLRQGWNNIEVLDEKQMQDLKFCIKACRG